MTMPVYDYKCQNCGNVWLDVKQGIREHPPVCCNVPMVRQPSMFSFSMK